MQRMEGEREGLGASRGSGRELWRSLERKQRLSKLTDSWRRGGDPAGQRNAGHDGNRSTRHHLG